MRHTLLSVAFLTLMMPSMGRADDADAEKQVAKVAKQHREAEVKGDTQALNALLADDWVAINPEGSVQSKAECVKDHKAGVVDFEAIDPQEVKVRVYGDAAVVSGRYHVKLTLSGHKIDDRVRGTEVYVRQGGKWRCVSTQVTSIAGKTGDKR
jgi:ketosteroid isomerase-like protein